MNIILLLRNWEIKIFVRSCFISSLLKRENLMLWRLFSRLLNPPPIFKALPFYDTQWESEDTKVNNTESAISELREEQRRHQYTQQLGSANKVQWGMLTKCYERHPALSQASRRMSRTLFKRSCWQNIWGETQMNVKIYRKRIQGRGKKGRKTPR